MDVPDWVWDELRLRTKGGAGLLIALAIFRHGGGRNAEAFPQEGIEHRARVRTTVAGLAKMAGISKRSCEYGLKELKELGMLEESTPAVRNGGRSFSMPYAFRENAAFAQNAAAEAPDAAKIAHGNGEQRNRGADFARSPDSSRARANGGGGEDRFLTRDQVEQDPITTTTEIPREQILRVLHALNIDSISSVLSNHGEANVYGALRVLNRAMGESTIANPAGYLIRTLEKSEVFDVPEDAGFLEELAAILGTATSDAAADHAKWKRSPFSKLKL